MRPKIKSSFPCFVSNIKLDTMIIVDDRIYNKKDKTNRVRVLDSYENGSFKIKLLNKLKGGKVVSYRGVHFLLSELKQQFLPINKVIALTNFNK